MSVIFSTAAEHVDAIAAYKNITTTSLNIATTRDAAIAYAWHLSSANVQSWVARPTADAKLAITGNAFADINPLPVPNNELFVNHFPIRQSAYLNREFLDRLPKASDPLERLELGIEQLKTWRRASSAAVPLRLPITWLANRKSTEAYAPFNSTPNPSGLLRRLGLYHFGKMRALGAEGIARFTYALPSNARLYKPDWRHGYSNFYFATCPQFPDAGRTRCLSSGMLAEREWLVHNEDVDPETHLTHVDYVPISSDQDFSDLPQLYWENFATAICTYRDAGANEECTP